MTVRKIRQLSEVLIFESHKRLIDKFTFKKKCSLGGKSILLSFFYQQHEVINTTEGDISIKIILIVCDSA